MTTYNTWGTSWSTNWGVSWVRTQTATRDQGAGAGHGRFKDLEQYRKIGEAIAASHKLDIVAGKPKKKTEKQTRQEITEYLETLPEFSGNTVTLREIDAIAAIIQEINLADEDDAIAFMMLMAA